MLPQTARQSHTKFFVLSCLPSAACLLRFDDIHHAKYTAVSLTPQPVAYNASGGWVKWGLRMYEISPLGKSRNAGLSEASSRNLLSICL